MNIEKNYYEILSVSSTASTGVIKAAYKALVQNYHPDKQTSEEDKAKSHKKMLEITEAFNVLSDPDKRSLYDKRYAEKDDRNDKSERSADKSTLDLAIIPLTVELTHLKNRVYEYLASGDYTPDDLILSAEITSQKISYIPTYIFKINYIANWTASFGYDRRVPESKRRSDGSIYTDYRIETDWYPHSGLDSGVVSLNSYGIYYPASTDLIDYIFANGTVHNFTEFSTSDIGVEKFSLSEQQSFDVIKSKFNSKIESNIKKHAQGDRQRDWHWTLTHKYVAYKILIPLCHAKFIYEGKEYDLWTDGVHAKEISATPLPQDKKRRKKVYIGFIPATLASISPFVLNTKYPTDFLFYMALGAWVLSLFFGIQRRKHIIDSSKKLRENILNRIIRNQDPTETATLSVKNSIFQFDKITITIVTLVTLIMVNFSSLKIDFDIQKESFFNGNILETDSSVNVKSDEKIPLTTDVKDNVNIELQDENQIQTSNGSSSEMNYNPNLSPLALSSLNKLFDKTDPSGTVKVSNNKLATIWFEQEFDLNAEHYHVIFIYENEIDAEGNILIDSITSVPVHIVTYKKNSAQWELVTVQKNTATEEDYITINGKPNGLGAEIIKISNDKLLFLIEESQESETEIAPYAYEEKYKNLFLYADNKWSYVDKIYISATNKDYISENEKAPIWEYQSTVSLIERSNQFPDLKVNKTGTELDFTDNGTKVVTAKDTFYRFNGKHYEKIKEYENKDLSLKKEMSPDEKPLTNNECYNLWYKRNLIFAKNGYCFESNLGKQEFSNFKCSTHNPVFSENEKNTINQIKAKENDLNCDTNTSLSSATSSTLAATGEPSKLIRNLLNFAVDNGGITHESEIQQIVTQITSAPKNKSGNKKLARGLNDKGHAFLKDEDFDSAIEMFAQAHKADPFDIEIANNLGFSNMKSDNLDAAEKYLIETLVLSPTRATAWSNLGDVYALKDEENKAIACYANMYRFSKNRVNTHKFIKQVNASEDIDSLKTAREKAIRLANSWFMF